MEHIYEEIRGEINKVKANLKEVTKILVEVYSHPVLTTPVKDKIKKAIEMLGGQQNETT